MIMIDKNTCSNRRCKEGEKNKEKRGPDEIINNDRSSRQRFHGRKPDKPNHDKSECIIPPRNVKVGWNKGQLFKSFKGAI